MSNTISNGVGSRSDKKTNVKHWLTMDKTKTRAIRRFAAAVTVNLALIENAMEAAEIEVRPSDNMKMKNFETSSWKPVQWKEKSLSMYVHLYMNI